jgi:TIR domain
LATKIFISYRRGESETDAHRIYDKLCSLFGDMAVFIDDNIPYGNDFRDHIVREISKSSIVLALMGPDWLRSVQERSDDPEDWLRLEIEAALQLNIPIIPALISNTPMPSAKDLPRSIQLLAFSNAVSISQGADFHRDMDKLVDSLIADHGLQVINTERQAEEMHDAERSLQHEKPGSIVVTEASLPALHQSVRHEDPQWVSKGPFLIKERLDEEEDEKELKLDVRIKPGRDGWPDEGDFIEDTDEDGLPILFWRKHYAWLLREKLTANTPRDDIDVYMTQYNGSESGPCGCFIWRSKLKPNLLAQFVYVNMDRSLPIELIGRGPLRYEQDQKIAEYGLVFFGLGFWPALIASLALPIPTWAALLLMLFLLYLLTSCFMGTLEHLRERAFKRRVDDYKAAEEYIWSGESLMNVLQRPWESVEGFPVKQNPHAVFVSFGIDFDEVRIDASMLETTNNKLSRRLIKHFVKEKAVHRRLAFDRSVLRG